MAALTGVVAVGVAHNAPSEAEPGADPGFCPTLQIVAAAALYNRVPPPSSSPDLMAFVEALNAELSTVRTQIEESCRGRQ